MRALFVSDEFPWPAVDGYRMRVANALAAAVSQAEVDLFVASDARQPDDRTVPPATDVRRVAVVDRPVLRRTPGRLARWVVSGLPRALSWRSWDVVVPAFWEFAGGRSYDVVWYSHPDMFVALRRSAGRARVAALGPAVVDLDNLESFKSRHQIAARAVGHRAELLAERLDAPRWRRLEHRVADAASAVVVCSELDARRLGSANVVVGPNGYERSDASSDTRTPRPLAEGPPTAVFIGSQVYPPNADASRWLADEIWPGVRARVPEAELRIVGRGGEALGVGGPGVTVTGAVPDIDVELARAHLTVLPIRYGGGTRIKLLEAFAYGLPAVATTVAAEGVAARSGEELILADDRDSLVTASVALLTDEDLRSRLARSSQELWSRQYRWAPVRIRLGDLIREVGTGHGAPASHA